MALNVPGVLSKIAEVFEKHKVKVVALNFPPKIQADVEASMFIAGDFTKAEAYPEEVKEELECLDKIREVKHITPQHHQVIVDPYHFPVVDDVGMRSIVFSEGDMKSLVVDFMKVYGAGGKAFLYHQGRVIGMMTAERHKEMGIVDLKSSLELLMLRSFALGRYRGELIHYSHNDVTGARLIIIRAYDNWECEIAKKHSIKGPASHFERGIIAGLVEAHIKEKVTVEEVKCIALNNSYCEFRIIS